MKARFLVLMLVLSLDMFLARVNAGGPVCSQDSDCDCSDVVCGEGATPVAACCQDADHKEPYCECNCNSANQPSCTS
jgi:hypothetical protein